MRPKLPSMERLAPYLQTIDRSRVYSNFGPLTASLEERLASHFGVPDGTITTVANATIGLTLALIAQDVLPGSLCLMPAWTFVASAHAARMAGLIPYFVDVDQGTWALDSRTIADAIVAAPARVGAVMPVAPFGSPIDFRAWERLRLDTGLPIVIDAAAGFDSVSASTIPTVVSLHATKIFGVGEGGFVLSTDTSLVRDIRRRSNFGFLGSREATTSAANAKLSEYHAAVGLAGLDEWDEVRREWLTIAGHYRSGLSRTNRVRFQEGFGTSWITSTFVLELPATDAAAVKSRLEGADIETRQWWGLGAHAHPATDKFPRAALNATEILARSTIAVPFFRDIKIDEIQRVASGILAVTDS
jgi:dTDP-4-amino-4,6-dideoxygalactose transaminase